MQLGKTNNLVGGIHFNPSTISVFPLSTFQDQQTFYLGNSSLLRISTGFCFLIMLEDNLLILLNHFDINDDLLMVTVPAD